MLENKQQPQENDVFAIHGGDYVGEMWVFIEQDEKYHFLCIPKLEIRSVDIQTFEAGQDIEVVRFVEQMDDDVYDVCCKQYLFLKEQ